MIITSNDATFFTTGTERVIEIKKHLVRILDKYKAYWVGNRVTNWTYEIIESQFDGVDQVYQIDIMCGLSGKPKLNIVCFNTYLSDEYGPIERTKLKERLWENLLDEICLMGVVKAYQGTIEVLRNSKDDGVLNDLRKYPLSPSEALNPGKL